MENATHNDHDIDWLAWLQRWDRQQTGYLPSREERFAVMLDALDVLLPDSFLALDLACGPGSFTPSPQLSECWRTLIFIRHSIIGERSQDDTLQVGTPACSQTFGRLTS